MKTKCLLTLTTIAALLLSGCEHFFESPLKNPDVTTSAVTESAQVSQSTAAPKTESTDTAKSQTTPDEAADTTADASITSVVTTTVPVTTTVLTTTEPPVTTTVTSTEAPATTTVPESTAPVTTVTTNVPEIRQPMTERWNGISLLPIYDNGMEFVWNQLSDDVKDNVAALMNAMRNLKQKVKLKHTVKEDQIWEFVHFVHDYLCGYTHVDFYNFRYWHDGNGNVTDVELNYTADSKQANEMNDALQAKVDEIVANAPDSSEWDRIKYFHDYVVTNCTYSFEGSHIYTSYGVLIDGKAVCQGYANAMQMLLSRAGFDAVPAIGDADGGYHKWNYVKLSDGKWYVIDATWDDPTGDAPDYVGYDYFMITDEQVEKDHSHRYGSRYFTVPTAK